jgi:hypothetical protein
MRAKDRYRKGQVVARDGRHEEALREYEWFHDHALEDEPALYGVRLSFALANWVDLGKIYPPALASLQAVRDRKSARLRAGEGDRELFHDVEAINESLGDYECTYDLLVDILQQRPDLAKKCAGLAMRSIVHVGDFALARGFIDEPEQSVRRWARMLNQDVADLASEPPSEVPKLEAYVHNYADRVTLLLSVLRGVGEELLANSTHQQALSCIESDAVRDAVGEALNNGREG